MKFDLVAAIKSFKTTAEQLAYINGYVDAGGIQRIELLKEIARDKRTRKVRIEAPKQKRRFRWADCAACGKRFRMLTNAAKYCKGIECKRARWRDAAKKQEGKKP